ncbi:MAG: hypothetical protein FWE06_05965 [Oscillospiraceae bacterium]|nr:hypothetical protein [Oscillospiraceae bacterium]
MLKKYAMYLLRWQLSTPILAAVLWLLASHTSALIATIVANLIGGLIFFWVDRFIFKSKNFFTVWETRADIECSDCGAKCLGHRLVKTDNYDKTDDNTPQFRCADCSAKKTEALRERGVSV